MEKHLLVTVSEQKSTMYGIKFVGHFFSKKEGMKLTLFYTAPRPPAVWAGERTIENLALTEQRYEEIESKGQQALETAQKELGRLGFKQERIITKLRFRKVSKVADIINEGAEGLYDAVVLGRRGLSWLEEALDESITRGLMEKKWNFPIWLCRRPDLERKNVLLCVDGSEAAYRIVDHVGFILGQEEGQGVTLFLVKKKGKIAAENTESILSKSRDQLVSNGFPANLIKTKVVEGGSVRKAILDEAEQGRYAAVAVGRTGAGQGLLEKIFMGSVSDTLFRELERAALWVCH